LDVVDVLFSLLFRDIKSFLPARSIVQPSLVEEGEGPDQKAEFLQLLLIEKSKSKAQLLVHCVREILKKLRCNEDSTRTSSKEEKMRDDLRAERSIASHRIQTKNETTSDTSPLAEKEHGNNEKKRAFFGGGGGRPGAQNCRFTVISPPPNLGNSTTPRESIHFKAEYI
jgi:hypothetical protein